MNEEHNNNKNSKKIELSYDCIDFIIEHRFNNITTQESKRSIKNTTGCISKTQFGE